MRPVCIFVCGTLAAIAACGSVDSSGVDASSELDGAPGPDGPFTVDGAPTVDVSPGLCNTDSDCPAGTQWCVAGDCVPCDNSGLVCDILCSNSWMPYQRNGCFPCECAPTNECASNNDCAPGQKCYAGAFCWDWCPPADPSCCLGNICSQDGCVDPPPLGCVTRGCPAGQSCDTTTGCVPSSCSCTGGLGGWVCTEDCGGGVCI